MRMMSGAAAIGLVLLAVGAFGPLQDNSVD